MAANTETSKKSERRKWLDRKQRNDATYARLFCNDCTRYVGAAGTCDCNS